MSTCTDSGPDDGHYGRTPAQAYDERPAKGGGNYEEGVPNGADIPSIARRLNPDSPEGAAPPSQQLPDGFPPDLPAPEPFSAAGESPCVSRASPASFLFNPFNVCAGESPCFFHESPVSFLCFPLNVIAQVLPSQH